MRHWSSNSVIYHIYPLGLCGAPSFNDFHSPVYHRLEYLYHWMDHLQGIGVNTVYFGPLFESTSHGYDTADYYNVDRRLGNRETLAKLIHELHQRNIRVIFDAVFNHVGRNFWAFRDVLQKGQYSWYCDWFQNLKFGKKSPFNDPFTYKSWKGHYSLVKLNLKNNFVKEHLFKAVEMWIYELGADGLRIDAADCIRIEFLRELAKFCKRIKHDFWLVGEIVHGDYRKWAGEGILDSVTNYDCYNSLISSHNNSNYFEIANNLKNKFGMDGIYRHLTLYNFVDNHDVNRIASKLKKPAHLYPLYALLFTMPGAPSVYYGSEWGIKGKRKRNNDNPLRPFLEINKVTIGNKNKDLIHAVTLFSRVRHSCNALRFGNFTELYVSREQIAFARQTLDQCIIVIINSSQNPTSIEFYTPMIKNGILADLLNNGENFQIYNNKLKVEVIWPCWGRILVLR